MNSSPSFTVQFALRGAELVISYEVVNTSARDLYLLNRLLRTTPTWSMSADHVYVRLEPDTKTLALAKKIPDLPPGMNVTSPVSPYLTPVRAGATFSEEVHLPLPASEHQEYAIGRNDRSTHVETYEKVRFTVQYFWRTEGMTEETRDLNGIVVTLTRGGVPLKVSDFGLLVAERDMDLPVIVPDP